MKRQNHTENALLMCQTERHGLECEITMLKFRVLHLESALRELVERAEAEGNIEGLPEYIQAREALMRMPA
jgi:hypothetical protein